eukprot:scaffold14558_cov137-Cylindrotheca_fusiformis.AAC.2
MGVDGLHGMRTYFKTVYFGGCAICFGSFKPESTVAVRPSSNNLTNEQACVIIRTKPREVHDLSSIGIVPIVFGNPIHQ